MRGGVADWQVHIGVDGRELLDKPTGVGRYLREVLRQWVSDPAWPHRITVIAPGEPRGLGPELSGRVSWVVDKSPHRGTWWEQRRLPSLLKRVGAEVLFAPGYTAPLSLPCPFVVAIYDLSFFAHPEWFGFTEGWRRRWLTRSAATRAHRIITCSEFSAQEIVRLLTVQRSRIDVAYPGAPSVSSVTDVEDREPIVLYAGSLFTRRRIPDLIAGFALAAKQHPDARLVLVGDNRTRPHIDPRAIAQAEGIASRVAWQEYVSDDELTALYGHARVFAFLSDYEGFGISPLEALAHGVPSVLLDTPISREAFLGAARLVAPSPDSIAAGISSLLGDDRAHRELVFAGRRVLDRFTWQAAARTIRRALETAAVQAR
jgi:glycosyltransferase involved in cell wall biosynthesis